MNQYFAISRVYDRLNADIDYSKWADGVEAAFLKIMGKKPELVLDLGCGTGRMTFELAHRGYDMTGIDLSIDMLMQARDRQRDEDILWLNQDMRSFELYGSVGAVVCCLDAVNYLLKLEDVENASPPCAIISIRAVSSSLTSIHPISLKIFLPITHIFLRMRTCIAAGKIILMKKAECAIFI